MIQKTDSLIELIDVEKTYSGGGSSGVTALRSISMRVARGERVAILGKSGSGKSTLLNLIGGLDRATSGTLIVDGSELRVMHRDGLARFRRETVGMIFQSYNLLSSRTAAQNVEIPLLVAGRPRRERRVEAAAALDAVGLGDRAKHRPTELSGGEMQRVAVARALVNKPTVLLADEPTGNLDTATARDVLDLLVESVSTRSATLLLVTHDIELARRAADRIVRIVDGRIVEESSQ